MNLEKELFFRRKILKYLSSQLNLLVKINILNKIDYGLHNI